MSQKEAKFLKKFYDFHIFHSNKPKKQYLNCFLDNILYGYDLSQVIVCRKFKIQRSLFFVARADTVILFKTFEDIQ